MPNGVKMISFQEYKKLTSEEKDYHIYAKLSILHDLDKRFASKWVERAAVLGGSTILITVLGAIVALVIVR